MAKAVTKLVKVATLGAVDLDPDTPKLPDPIEAPDPEAQAAEQSRALQRRRRTGRTSTILTDGSNSLG